MTTSDTTTPPRYRTTPLRPEFVGADRGESAYYRAQSLAEWGDPDRIRLRYFTVEEQEHHRLHFREGRLYQWNKRTGQPERLCENGHELIFVMDGHGEFFAEMAFSDRANRLTHASLLAGAPVAGAGRMEVRRGKVFRVIPRVDDDAYALTLELYEQVLSELARRGVDLRGCEVLRSWLDGR